MRIGLKLHHEPFVVAELPDTVQLVKNRYGAPDVLFTGMTPRPLEALFRAAKENRYGCCIVDSAGFAGETHIVMGVFGYKLVHGIPGPTDLLPGQS